MPDSCCAYGCTKHREENVDRTFYGFPRRKKEEQQELQKRWVQAYRRENGSEQKFEEIISLQVSTMAWYIPQKFLFGYLSSSE